MRAFFLVAAVLLGVSALAQQSDAISADAEWNPLPDSLFLRWKLDVDQVKRLRMIEEDYEADRSAVVNDRGMSEAARDAAVRQLANARRNEVKGVLRAEHYDDWIRRTER